MKTIRLCAFLLLAFGHAYSQDPLELSAEEFPRVPATEPAKALETFEVEEGFKLELVAHEPDVMDPIAMAFDEKGRAYVLEMRGYSERREEALGRVRLLTDSNGDGKFDQSTIFKDGLKWPTAILCYKGGVFLGATPDVHYLKDTDGDGVADESKHLFTGFGEGPPRLNMQALFNSFRWGPDNRIWGSTGRNGGVVKRIGDAEFEPVNLRGADFSFDPEELDLRAENGTAQYGLSFDSQGRRFICSNSRHLIWVAYERHHVKPNPWYQLPPPLVDIPDDGAAAPVYRISPDEPWRIIRTRWRVSGVVKGVVEGGGRVSGYFTAATGVHIYTGDAYGDAFRNNAFIGDAGSNLVHRKEIYFPDDGVQPVASRPDPGQQTEFMRSSDNWFRPTSFTTGPDGCLYVTDMYRETIEHPWSLPEPIKKHLDLNSGWDRGRLYRMAPVDYEQKSTPDLGALTDEQLAALLTHENDWHRTTARRLLYERGLPADPMPPVDPFPATLAATAPLLDLIEEAQNDKWVRAAVLNSLRTSADLKNALSAISPLPFGDLHLEFATLLGRSGELELIKLLVSASENAPLDQRLVDEFTALREGVSEGGHDWKTITSDPAASGLFRKAALALTAPDTPENERIIATEILALSGQSEYEKIFQQAFSTSDSEVFRAVLSRAIKDNVFLVGHYETLSDATRTGLTPRISADVKAATRLLEAIRDESIALSGVPAQLINRLREHKAKPVVSLAAEVLPPVISREQIIEDYANALESPGDRARGKAAFTKACQACHISHEGEGIDLGPAIATFTSAGAESLLGNILDPNKEVAPQFQAFTFSLKTGETLVGIITSEDARSVTLKMPGGLTRTFPRTEVESMKGLGQSLMPEGLEASLTVDEMRDLLAYLAAPAR